MRYVTLVPWNVHYISKPEIGVGTTHNLVLAEDLVKVFMCAVTCATCFCCGHFTHWIICAWMTTNRRATVPTEPNAGPVPLVAPVDNTIIRVYNSRGLAVVTACRLIEPIVSLLLCHNRKSKVKLKF
ncbi:hypothetical protein VPHK251G3_0050 [Vibrio phage K251 g3]